MNPTQNNGQNKSPAASARKVTKRKKKVTLSEAVTAELRDLAGGFFRGALSSVEGADVARFFICAAILVVLASLQVTVFSKFRPFGAVPDIMLCFTVAIAFSEGEKFGGIGGLVAAFVIESLGGVGMTLLPLLYMPCGFFGGIAAKNMLGDTLLSRAALMGIAAVGRAAVSTVYSLVYLDAAFAQIMTSIVIPEFFSTLLLAPFVFGLVWLCYRNFHKTRAEKTEKIR